MKGFKTTIAAFVYLAILIGLIIVFVLDQITMDELKTLLAATTPVFVVIIGFLAKDANKSHTKI